MTSESRSYELKWRAAQQAAAEPRAELQSLLKSSADSTGVRATLVAPRLGVADPLLERYDETRQLRLGEDTLGQATERMAGIMADRTAGPWLIRPGRSEPVGIVRVQGDLSATFLEVLVRWDGEGLLLGSESGTDWILLDIDQRDAEMHCELLTSLEN